MRMTAFSIALLATTLAGAAVIGSTNAKAATGDTLSKSDAQTLCSRLSEQFDALTPFKKGLPYWQDAKADYTKGKQACDEGTPVKGARQLQAAISDLYVKPDTL